MGLELVAGYVFAWTVRRARRVGGRATAEVDRGLEAAMDRLHDVVTRWIGQDSALQRLNEEAEAAATAEPAADATTAEQQPKAPGTGALALPEPAGLSDRTRRRVQDVLDDAVEHDADFAAALEEALARLREAAGGALPDSAGSGGNSVSGNTFQGPTALVVGNNAQQTNTFKA